MAQALDDGIGRITSLLDAKGFADNTIIALTADNGGQNGVGGNNWPLRYVEIASEPGCGVNTTDISCIRRKGK